MKAPARPRGRAPSPLVPGLLLRRALGPRDRLQAGVGYRLAALHGEAVGALCDARLGALHRLQLVPQLLLKALAELGIEQVRCPVRGV